MNEDLRREDGLARALAQRQFQRPLVLEAGAGTGKTTTLVARVLAWCLGPGWELEARERGEARPKGTAGASPEAVAAGVLRGVAAITFTEAAAAEMASRIAQELAAVAAGRAPRWLDGESLPAPVECRRRGGALAAALDHLSVRTIHAFCRSLLADHPLEAGLHPQLVVDADGSAVERAVREIVEEAVLGAYGGGDEQSPLLDLARRGFGPAALVEALTALVQRGAQAELLAGDTFAAEDLAGLYRRGEGAFATLDALAAPLAGVSKRSTRTLETAAALGRSRELLAGALGAGLGRDGLGRTGLDQERLTQFLEQMTALWTDPLVSRLQDWSRGRFNKGEGEALGPATSTLPPAAEAAHGWLRHLRSLDPELLDLARRALSPLLARLRQSLRAQGVLTFDDLLHQAVGLLRSEDSVRRRVRRGLRQLLVDEFQDTDPLQCDLVRCLALEGPLDERPGLFLVGDPKQSIYGWRSADLAAYDQFLDEVRQAGGEIHSLSVNFRSVPAILEEVERVVAPVMHQERGLQPRFQPLLPCPELAQEEGFRTASAGPVEYWISWRLKEDSGPEQESGSELASPTAAAAAQLEAEALAADLLRLRRDGGLAWREAAVLLRSFTQLEVVLDALRRRSIPFAVGRTQQYYRRREVIEAAALIRLVLDPGDQLALLTVLRSPLVGVPDAALIPLFALGLPRLMMEPNVEAVTRITGEALAAMPQDIPGLGRIAGWEVNLITATQHLAHLRKLFREGSAAEFMTALRSLFPLEMAASSRYLGRYRLANLQRLYSQVEAALEGALDLGSLLRLLRRAVAEGQEAEEGQPPEGTEDAVRILTIHGAKGLGFEHVYLLQLHSQSATGTGPPTRLGGGAYSREYRLLGAPSLGFDQVERAEKATEAAERVRLLYVALTRAKRRLVLMGNWSLREAPAPEQARSLMDLLGHRRPLPDLEALPQRLAGPAGPSAEASSESAPPAVELAGARWVFPALAIPQVEELEAALPESPAVDEDQAERDALKLRELRSQARQRSARPWAATPSGAARWQESEADEESSPKFELAELRPGEPSGPRRSVATAVGQVVHRMLEDLDLSRPVQQSLAEQKLRAQALLASEVEAARLEEAEEALEELLEAFADGPLPGRLEEIRGGILARELPILLAPREQDPALGSISGVVDLLYRDPRNGETVIADYKTDRISSAEAVAARARHYHPQGELYRRAVQGAFQLPELPRFELWFLRAGQIVEVSASEPASGSG